MIYVERLISELQAQGSILSPSYTGVALVYVEGGCLQVLFRIGKLMRLKPQSVSLVESLPTTRNSEKRVDDFELTRLIIYGHYHIYWITWGCRLISGVFHIWSENAECKAAERLAEYLFSASKVTTDVRKFYKKWWRRRQQYNTFAELWWLRRIL